ncbi:hypothetical protein BDY21DRAFT_258598, partial [Lineolata rhizophorae]
MGRTEPSSGLPPQSTRRDARAKHAKATLNKTIPDLLRAYPRARAGLAAAELITSLPDQQTTNNKTRRGSVSESPQEATEPEARAARFRLRLIVADSITAALDLSPPRRPHQHSSKPPSPNPGLLNMASPLRPGGGFLTGATGQEESLCLRTTLLPSLREPFYRLPERGAVRSPDVLVFRDGAGRDLSKADRRWVDVVSAGMLRFPDVEWRGREGGSKREGEGEMVYANEKDRELVRAKMEVVMGVFRMCRCRKVVLGAWGCGAYGNPVGEVARAWRKVLLGSVGGGRGKGKGKGQATKQQRRGPVWEGIEEVVFAITDQKMAEKFRKAFGEEELEYVQERGAEGDSGAGGGGDEEERPDDGPDDDAEMRAKIAEMGEQMEKATNPDLKARLQNLVDNLKRQM